MKAIQLCVFFMVTAIYTVLAQEPKNITVKAGTRIIDYFPFNDRYRYPEFRKGTAHFTDQTFTVALFNYNILLGELQFIQKKDTLALVNVKNIEFIEISQDTFYFDNGVHEVLAGRDPVLMTMYQYVQLIDTKKEGAYGSKSSTGAVTSYGTVYGRDSKTIDLVVNEDMVFSKKTLYYIGNPKDGFVLYRKNAVYKLFPDDKESIKQYIEEKKIDFGNKSDLVALTAFLLMLQ